MPSPACASTGGARPAAVRGARLRRVPRRRADAATGPRRNGSTRRRATWPTSAPTGRLERQGDIAASIRTARSGGAMPAFRDITDPEASDIAAWIVSLPRPGRSARESQTLSCGGTGHGSGLPRSAAIMLASVSWPAASRARRPASMGGARPGFGGDFTLTNQDNQPFRLQDVRGRAVLLFFGYTSCPDMCPMTMSRISERAGAGSAVRVARSSRCSCRSIRSATRRPC